MSCHFKHRVFGMPRGSVAIEFALLVPILLILAFAVIDFGQFVWTRQVVTEVSRLGGGLVFHRDDGYIDIEDDQKREELLDLLEKAGSPIFKSGNSRIVVSKIKKAQKIGDSPMIVAQVERGDLVVTYPEYRILPDIPGEPPQDEVELPQDALQHLYSHLDYPTAEDPPDKSEIGVVEVFYKYVPITPLPYFIEGILQMDNGGVIINSKAFF